MLFLNVCSCINNKYVEHYHYNVLKEMLRFMFVCTCLDIILHTILLIFAKFFAYHLFFWCVFNMPRDVRMNLFDIIIIIIFIETVLNFFWFGNRCKFAGVLQWIGSILRVIQ